MSPGGDQLRGSFVPLVTPFRDGAVDVDAFAESVQRHVEAGSHGVVVTGTTGEPTSLYAEERARLYRVAVEAAEGRIPVVAATGSANQDETLKLTRQAEEAGAAAALVLCPPFVKPSQAALEDHFTTVAASTDLPVLIYNIPGRAAVGILPETVERIVARAPNLVGLKHASQDLDVVTDLLLRLGDDFRLFCGLESYSYPFLAVGGAGLMNAVGNLLPTEVARLCELVAAGDHEAALAVHRRIFRLNEAIFWDTNPVPLKAMLAMLGQGSEEARPPLGKIAENLRAPLRALLDQVVAAEEPA